MNEICKNCDHGEEAHVNEKCQWWFNEDNQCSCLAFEPLGDSEVSGELSLVGRRVRVWGDEWLITKRTHTGDWRVVRKELRSDGIHMIQTSIPREPPPQSHPHYWELITDEPLKPFCSTCGKDVAEILCEKCSKWWKENQPEPQVKADVDLLEPCDGCGCARHYHVVNDKTLEGYCSFPKCACTKFDKFDDPYDRVTRRPAVEPVSEDALIDRLRQEAQIHALEARSANATIAEIYQIVTGGKGEPGNWHGAEPVRQAFASLTADRNRLKIALADAIRRPMGVVPVSAEGLLTQAEVDAAEARREALKENQQ